MPLATGMRKRDRIEARRGDRVINPRLAQRRGGRQPRGTYCGIQARHRAQRDEDLPALRELIDAYADALFASEQTEAAEYVRALLDDPAAHFRAIRPGADITDQTVSTE